jgi:hypothetical protein
MCELFVLLVTVGIAGFIFWDTRRFDKKWEQMIEDDKRRLKTLKNYLMYCRELANKKETE